MVRIEVPCSSRTIKACTFPIPSLASNTPLGNPSHAARILLYRMEEPRAERDEQQFAGVFPLLRLFHFSIRAVSGNGNRVKTPPLCKALNNNAQGVELSRKACDNFFRHPCRPLAIMFEGRSLAKD